MLLDAYGRPLECPIAPETRDDSWTNERTGIGTIADKTMHGRFGAVFRIYDVELTDLYNGSALAAKIVEKPVREMWRCGYKLRCDGVDEGLCDELQEHAQEALHLDEHLEKAQIFGDLYGGALEVMGAVDGGAPNEPLDESRIQSFTFLNSIDRRFAYTQSYYSGILEPKNGEPELYLTSNAVAMAENRSGKKLLAKKSGSAIARSGGQTAIVHESRVLRLEGVSTDIVTQQTLAGWTWSVLQRLYDDLRKFEHAFDSMQYLLSDASQAVFTIEGLHAAISKDNGAAVLQRIALIEQIRSVMHGVLLDVKAGEKYERAQTPFGGIADLLDKCMLRFAASADIPVTELFGRAASGLNAAAGADAETRKWYDKIGSRQKTKAAPPLKRAYRLLAASADCPVKLPKAGKDGRPLRWRIEFNPLTTPTDDEQAATDLKIAQRDQIYLTEQTVTNEEVAPTLKRLYPDMDLEARKKAAEAAKSFDPYANDPEPDPIGGGELPPPGGPGGLPGQDDQPPAPPAPAPKPGAAKKPPAKTKPAPKTDTRRRRAA